MKDIILLVANIVSIASVCVALVFNMISWYWNRKALAALEEYERRVLLLSAVEKPVQQNVDHHR